MVSRHKYETDFTLSERHVFNKCCTDRLLSKNIKKIGNGNLPEMAEAVYSFLRHIANFFKFVVVVAGRTCEMSNFYSKMSN